jgi:hypothetical protein
MQEALLGQASVATKTKPPIRFQIIEITPIFLSHWGREPI